VVCAGLCIEGRRRVVCDGCTEEQGGAPRGAAGRGPRQERGEGSEPVLRSGRDSAMEAGTIEVEGRALVLLLVVEERG
jgi:hypothetical protein